MEREKKRTTEGRRERRRDSAPPSPESLNVDRVLDG
jgi:hypothetical protein